jgi:hypothetical protein
MNFLAALLYAVSSSTLLAVLLAFLRGGLNPAIAAYSLGFGALVASCSFWRDRFATPTAKPPRGWDWGAIAAFTLISLRIFLWLVFRDGDSIKVLSPNNLGDLSLHLTYIHYLASGVPFWPDNPIFTGGKLTYPVGTDLFNSLLLLIGADPLRSLIWTGLAGSALTGVALWRWGRGFALFGFMANGGLAGFALYSTHQLSDFQGELAWKSIALSLFATQRGLLYALPAGLALLISWRARLFGDDEEEWRLPLWGEVLLYASMPLFHIHTFLFLSLMLGAWFLMHASARRELLRIVGISLVPATALVLLITGMMHGAHVLGIKMGWMWDDETFKGWCDQHWGHSSRFLMGATFWPLNFGLLPLFVIALCWMLLREKFYACAAGRSFREMIALCWSTFCDIFEYPWTILREMEVAWDPGIVFPALFAFLVCCFVKFAPWEWDNTKIMIWAYIAILPTLWTRVIMRWPEWARALACFALFWSGFVSTLGGIDQTHQGYEIATRSELTDVAQAVRRIPISERFVGYPTYNHPLLLCGRKMALGYLGHVSSHGLAWETPAREVASLMNGDADWRQCAADLHVRYLFWGKPERECEDYRLSSEPWKDECRIVASGPWGDIYDLQSAVERVKGN